MVFNRTDLVEAISLSHVRFCGVQRDTQAKY